MSAELQIDGERLWDSLMQMAEIGATDKGGCNRQALTDEDKQGRDLFIEWARATGCQIIIDSVGNIFARREGTDPSMPPVLAGSHLDTQPTGGKFDGVYGVLAGLEVVRTLVDKGIVTKAPIEIAAWTNEEGARFAPACLGSGVWCGVFTEDEAYGMRDKSGATFGEELDRIGYKGSEPASARPLTAAFEAHIEQGPILENCENQIGVLTGIQGCRWYDLVIEGEAIHAGPSPMESRKDPFMAALPIMHGLYALATEYAPHARVTFGDIKAEPGARNTVPERLEIAVDLRHPDRETFELLDKRFRALVASECTPRGLRGSVSEVWHMPVTEFDADCIAAVAEATERLGYPSMKMVSGAGHDSLYLATVAPTSMIFVPCENGISHNEVENAKPEDLTAGCNVLLHAMLSMAIAVEEVSQ